MARSHLMQLRARNLREARAQTSIAKSGQPYTALPWRFEHAQESNSGPSRPQRMPASGRASPSREATQSRRPRTASAASPDPGQSSSDLRRSDESRHTSGTTSGHGSPTLWSVRIHELSDGVHGDGHLQTPVSTLDSKLRPTETLQDHADRVSGSSRGPSTASDAPAPASRGSRAKTLDNIENDHILAPAWQLEPPDLQLYQYFHAHSTKMFRFSLVPEFTAEHRPIERLFLPIALSSRWCFEVVVLLFAASYQRSHDPDQAVADHHVGSIQDRILKAARERITAIVEHHDSTDADVLAFLLLAIVEFRFGDKRTGAMHLDAWQRYLIMRRECNVAPCGFECKMAVWWCIAMLLSPEEPLPVVFDCKDLVDRIREDPARLFRRTSVDTMEGRPDE
jgi:hypothetical protein